MATNADNGQATEDVIYHLTTQAEWVEALAKGEYAQSTRGRSLEEVGFIHCSTSSQLSAVAEFVYADCEEALIVLALSLSALESSGVPVRFEDGGNGTLYPHIYAALPCTQVQQTLPAAFDRHGRFVLA